MSKVSARWVPRLLKDTEKDLRVACSTEILRRFELEADRFLNRIITFDETWIHDFDPETKLESSVWKTPRSPARRKALVQSSVGKEMFIYFIDRRGMILEHKAKDGRMVNADYYSKASGYSGRMSNPNLLVGAIDFGTTYSGWAYLFYHDFKVDPTKGYTKQWHSGSGTLVTEKTPTVVLIRPDGKTLEAFGYDAESRYRELVDTGGHHDYYYFRNFKMMLHKQLSEKLDRSAQLSDEMGKSLTAMDVFAMSIKYLVDDMHETTRLRTTGTIEKSDVHWVLTVHAIWTDTAKQFMREAAEKAGIDRYKLSIALEPEAASIYCRHLPVDKTVGQTSFSISLLPVGTRYMIVDAGGGTVDITIHEVIDSGKIKELKAASGGGWGGILVNQAFEELLQDIVGREAYKSFQFEYTEDWLEIMREFEVKKKMVHPEKDGRIMIRFPVSLSRMSEQKRNMTLEEYIRDSADYSDQVEFLYDKMKFNANIFKQLFEKANKKILQHISSLTKDTLIPVSVILMVGGFSESPMLQTAIRNLFPSIKIVIPNDASIAVLKGALICGHRPAIITERVLRYTYGIDSTEKFVEGKHPGSKRIVTDRGVLCHNIFSIHVQKGQIVKVGEPQVTQTYLPLNRRQKSGYIRLFATEKKTPYFIDHDCIEIGTMKVDSLVGGLYCKVDVTLTFSGTEIKVEAVVRSTGQKTNVAIDFLG